MTKVPSTGLILRSFLAVRCSLLVVCLGLIAKGWYNSVLKFTAGDVLVSTSVNETHDPLPFPSVTFCPPLRNASAEGAGLVDLLEGETAGQDGSLDGVDIQDLVERSSYRHDEFLTMVADAAWLTSSLIGDDEEASNLNRLAWDPSYWSSSVADAHGPSGRCYTFESPDLASPGWFNGVWFGIRVPDDITAGLNDADEARTAREKWMAELYIFVHRRGRFYMYLPGDFPDNHRIPQSMLRQRPYDNSVSLAYRHFAAMDKEDRRCVDDHEYDFGRCVEDFAEERRGCRLRWGSDGGDDDDTLLPTCNNATTLVYGALLDGDLDGWLSDSFRSMYSEAMMSTKTGCLPPCSHSVYSSRVEYNHEVDGENVFGELEEPGRESEFLLHLWFRDYRFTYEKEVAACDWTCLVGEMGGSLGFFLGGSVLAYVDVALRWVVRVAGPRL